MHVINQKVCVVHSKNVQKGKQTVHCYCSIAAVFRLCSLKITGRMSKQTWRWHDWEEPLAITLKCRVCVCLYWSMFAQLIALTAICVFSQTLTEKMHQGPLIGLTASIYITAPLFGCRIKKCACKSGLLHRSLTIQRLEKSGLAINSISQNASCCSFYTVYSIHSVKTEVIN